LLKTAMATVARAFTPVRWPMVKHMCWEMLCVVVVTNIPRTNIVAHHHCNGAVSCAISTNSLKIYTWQPGKVNSTSNYISHYIAIQRLAIYLPART
jgi:hypothetical protein